MVAAQTSADQSSTALDDLYPATPCPDLEAITRPEREAFRAAVAQVAAHAKTKLPECNGRVEKAEALVLAEDVTLLDDGTAKVASQSNGETTYHLVNGHCTCRDFPQAPHQLCKHRLARGIAIRAGEHVPSAAAEKMPLPESPEAPHSIPAQYVVTIQGRPFIKFAGLLQMAHERGLVSLMAEWTYNDAELSLAHAVAVFADGKRFEECGDASPRQHGEKRQPALPAGCVDQK